MLNGTIKLKLHSLLLWLLAFVLLVGIATPLWMFFWQTITVDQIRTPGYQSSQISLQHRQDSTRPDSTSSRTEPRSSPQKNFLSGASLFSTRVCASVG